MSRYNPNSPDTLGCEFFSDLEGVDRLSGDLQLAGAVLASSVSETIDSVYVGLTGNAGRTSGWELEIYDVTDLPSAVTDTLDYLPACDFIVIDMFGAGVDTSDLFEHIDESVLNTADYISPIFGGGAEYACQFGSVSGTLDGLNIVKVQLRARVAELVDSALVEGATFVPFLIKDGRHQYGSPQTYSGEPGMDVTHTLVGEWYANPFTGASWKPQDLDEFDCVGGDSAAGWIIKPTGSSNNLAVIYQGYLRVEFIDEPDVRIAVGTLAAPTGQVGWQGFGLTAPDGTPGWTKINGIDYLFLMRRRIGKGYIDWRYLIDQEKPFSSPPDWTIVTPRLYPSTLTLAESGADQERDGVYAILLERDDLDMSADSQPYLSINDDGGPQARFQHVWTRVSSSDEVRQKITTVGADDYGVVRFLVCWETVRPDDDLLVNIRRESDDVQFGTTLTVEPMDLAEPRRKWQVFEAEIPGGPVALAGATQYYVEFLSNATAGTAWRVQVLSTLIDTDPGGPPVNAYDQTFNSIVDVGGVDGTDYPSLDVCVTIATQPDVLENVTSVVTMPEECRGYITTSWTASGDVDFLRYEVERSKDGLLWERIGNLPFVDDVAFVDVAAWRGVPVTYRVRQRRTDLSFSSWVEAEPVTLTAECCGYVLASNEARDYSVFIVDLNNRSYEFPRANEGADFMFLAGRDFGVGFGELEDRGSHFTFEGLVAASEPTEGSGVLQLTNPGIENFDALRWLLANMKAPVVDTKLALSHIAVLDETGHRWLAEVKILSATRNGTDGSHIATIQVRETQSLPTPVTIGGAGSGS